MVLEVLNYQIPNKCKMGKLKEDFLVGFSSVTSEQSTSCQTISEVGNVCVINVNREEMVGTTCCWSLLLKFKLILKISTH